MSSSSFTIRPSLNQAVLHLVAEDAKSSDVSSQTVGIFRKFRYNEMITLIAHGKI
jgi:hypothetical protein